MLVIAFLLSFASAQASVLRLDSGIYNDGTFTVGPVNMTLDGTAIQAMCVSIDLQSSFGTSWDVRSYNLGGDLSGFTLYNGTGESFRKLEEAGWLYQQTTLTTNTAAIAAFQQAAWILLKPANDHSHDSYLFNPGSASALAAAHAQTFTNAFASSVTYFQPTNSANQFFVTVVPEPSAFVLGFIGILGLTGLRFWGKVRHEDKNRTDHTSISGNH